jgi:hypothetical protein
MHFGALYLQSLGLHPAVPYITAQAISGVPAGYPSPQNGR